MKIKFTHFCFPVLRKVLMRPYTCTCTLKVLYSKFVQVNQQLRVN